MYNFVSYNDKRQRMATCKPMWVDQRRKFQGNSMNGRNILF